MPKQFVFIDRLTAEIKRVFTNFIIENFSGIEFSLFSNSIKYNKENIQISPNQDSKIIFDIDILEIFQYSEELADALLEQYIKLEIHLENTMGEFLDKYEIFSKLKHGKLKRLSIQFKNHPNYIWVNRLNNRSFGKISAISGELITISNIFPVLKKGMFSCSESTCKFIIQKPQDVFFYEEPTICPNCGNSSSWFLDINQSTFKGIRVIKIRTVPYITKQIKKGPIFQAIVDTDILKREKTGDLIDIIGFLVPIPQTIMEANTTGEGSFLNNNYLNLKFFSSNFQKKNSFGFAFKAISVSQIREGKGNSKLENQFFSCFPLNLVTKFCKFRKNIHSRSSIFNKRKFFLFDKDVLILLVLAFLCSKSKYYGENAPINCLNICIYKYFSTLDTIGTCILKNFFPDDFNLGIQKNGQIFLNSSISNNYGHLFNFKDIDQISHLNKRIIILQDYNQMPFISHKNILKATKKNLNWSEVQQNFFCFFSSFSILAFFSFNGSKKNYNNSSVKNLSILKTLLDDFDVNIICKKNDVGWKICSKVFVLVSLFSRINKQPVDYKMVQNLKPYLIFSNLLDPILTLRTKTGIVQVYKYLRLMKMDTLLGMFNPSIKELDAILKVSISLSKICLCQKITMRHISSACHFIFNGLIDINVDTLTSSNTRKKEKKEIVYNIKKKTISFIVDYYVSLNRKEGVIGLSLKKLLRLSTNSMEQKIIYGNFCNEPRFILKVLKKIIIRTNQFCLNRIKSKPKNFCNFTFSSTNPTHRTGFEPAKA